MTVKQISVFLENKPGILSEFIKLISAKNIDLSALSIAENDNYGILRIIVDKPDETFEYIKSEGYSCKMTEVLAVEVADTPGSLTKIFSVLAENDISLHYSYAFFSRTKGKAFVILRVADNDATSKILSENAISR